MLYLENEIVKITEDGMMLPETQALYKKDRRNESKPYFNKAISYVYWAYNSEGEYRNMLPTRRKDKAATRVLHKLFALFRKLENRVNGSNAKFW